ncbi:MAG: hypothetical protein Q9201_000745 [Fulgogasparrea decipioides]
MTSESPFLRQFNSRHMQDPARISNGAAAVLKKYVKKANLEAAGGAQEERVELNKREPDEGDLFGIRAIQSGFFGGVAQSRPSSLAESNSPEGSSSNTLLGSHASPKLGAQSPMSSVTTLPLEARRSSPLAHKNMSSEDLNGPTTPQRRVPTPLRSTLRPSDAELNGRVNHDPAVNMFLEIPPSPVATSRPSTAYMDSHDRTPSGYFPSPHNGGQYAPLGASQIPEQVKRSSARPVSTVAPQHPEKGHHSQSASIVSGSSDRSTQDSQHLPTAHEPSSVTVPSHSAQGERRGSSSSDERPRSRGRDSWLRPARSHPPRSSSRYSGFPQMPTIHSQEDEVTAAHQPHPPSAVGDWGHEIFHEIDQSLQESRSANVPSSNDRYNHHTSTLSDASSTYSTVRTGHRSSGRQISMDSKIQLQPRQFVGPESCLESSDQAARGEGKRRASDASSRELNTSDPSAPGSHRNTKEFGEFYDSYWRRSGQPQANGQHGNQNLKPADVARDGRRPGQLELQPETITEVPSPLPSPAIEKAM